MTCKKLVLQNVRLATLERKQCDPGLSTNAAVVIEEGLITHIGAQNTLESVVNVADTAVQVYDCGGRLLTPGLIDCHTHLVHAGNRAHEFEMRLNGASYADIARAGGGILSSVRNVRQASMEDLVAETLPRLDALLAEGVTTVEIKSGYGLTIEDELKMLQAARALAKLRKVNITTTYLAAHAIAPEYQGRKDDFITHVVLPGMEQGKALGLIDAVDGFCENIAFSPEDMRRVFTHAKALGLPVKLHADQLSNLNGAALAAEFSALSADHLEYLDEAGAYAMAQSGTVAVLLPGAFYFIRETQKPPIAFLRQAGTPMALATDNNPGTSPLTSLLLTMNMAATLFSMTVEECLAGVTREAARALGRLDDIGTIAPGKRADLALWSVQNASELVYRMGFNPLHARIFAGEIIPSHQN